MIVIVSLIAGVVGFVGGIANAIYWKRHPEGTSMACLDENAGRAFTTGRNYW